MYCSRYVPRSSSLISCSFLCFLSFLVFAGLWLGRPPSAHAQVGIEWVPVLAVGNDAVPDSGGVGAVDYPFEIARFEVTNNQYVGFLSAVAASDPNGLWSSFMQSNALGGIERTGSSGSYVYEVKEGMGDLPVVYVSFWDAARFANWLHNDLPGGAQDASTTEDGAYTLTPAAIAANSVVRNPGARFAIPDLNEWSKAGYYDDGSPTWYLSPAESQTEMSSGAPEDDDGNTGSCNRPVFVLEEVGSYALSISPWGTFDQGGNVAEWGERIRAGMQRDWLGSSYAGGCNGTSLLSATSLAPSSEQPNGGFRVVKPSPVPVPILGPVSIGALAVLVAGVGVGRLSRSEPTVDPTCRLVAENDA